MVSSLALNSPTPGFAPNYVTSDTRVLLVFCFLIAAERARRRKEARMERERARQGQEDHFNEDLLQY